MMVERFTEKGEAPASLHRTATAYLRRSLVEVEAARRIGIAANVEPAAPRYPFRMAG